MTALKHKPWCASVPRGMDVAMNRGPYACDCGAAIADEPEKKPMKAIITIDGPSTFTEVELVPETEDEKKLCSTIRAIKALIISWTPPDKRLVVHTEYIVEVETSEGLRRIPVHL